MTGRGLVVSRITSNAAPPGNVGPIQWAELKRLDLGPAGYRVRLVDSVAVATFPAGSSLRDRAVVTVRQDGGGNVFAYCLSGAECRRMIATLWRPALRHWWAGFWPARARNEW